MPGLYCQVSWQCLFNATAIPALLISAKHVLSCKYHLHILEVSSRIHSLNRLLLFKFQREYLSEYFSKGLNSSHAVSRGFVQKAEEYRDPCVVPKSLDTNKWGHIALVFLWLFFCLNWGVTSSHLILSSNTNFPLENLPHVCNDRQLNPGW